jgi:hypothetical protein
MAVALLALFVALGGTGYAAVKITGKNVKNGSLTGKDVKRNSLTGRQIKESSLAKVSRAGAADTASSAARAGDAATLGGRGPATFAPAKPEAVRVVGAPGQPGFASGWAFADITDGDEEPGFFKDLSGIVHLRGATARFDGTGTTVFTLPPGYRPKREQYFVTYGGPSTVRHLGVERDGDVIAFNVTNDGYTSLNGISFLAEQ